MLEAWTLDELADRVVDALAGGDYPGAPNGRVRQVPDRRSIRWYTTIGLLDRPGGLRGRTALYGPRHLAQLVAIKRRQAQGRTLADIQAELVGVSDAKLYEIAGLDPRGAQAGPGSGPGDPPGSAGGAPDPPSPARRAFWTQPAAPPPAAAPPAIADRGGSAPAMAGLLTGVPLDGGAVLLLPTAPDSADLAALHAAARPLVDLLTTRGLLRGPSRRSST